MCHLPTNPMPRNSMSLLESWPAEGQSFVCARAIIKGDQWMGFDSHRCGTQPIPVDNDIRIFVVFQVADELSGLTTPTILRDFVSESNPAAILENDGVLVTGSSVLDAFDRLEVLESTAEAVINARAIGDVSVMPESVIAELRSAFNLDGEKS